MPLNYFDIPPQPKTRIQKSNDLLRTALEDLYRVVDLKDYYMKEDRDSIRKALLEQHIQAINEYVESRLAKLDERISDISMSLAYRDSGR